MSNRYTAYTYCFLCIVLLLASCSDNSLPPLPDLDTPSAVTATVLSDSEILLRWPDQQRGLTGYLIERSDNNTIDWETIAELNNITFNFKDSELNEGTEYSYRIRGYSGERTSESSPEVSAVTELSPPTDLHFDTLAGDFFRFSWSDNSALETAYLIQRHVSYVSQFDTLTILPGNTSTYRDEGLMSNERYIYRIKALSETNESDWSRELYAVAIPPPTAFWGHATSDSSIVLQWVDQSPLDKGTIVERTTAFSDEWQEVATLAPQVHQFTDTGLAEGTIYGYRLTPLNDTLKGYPSNSIDILTLPKAPEDLTVEQSETVKSTILLSWQDRSSKEEGYVLQRRDNALLPFQTVAELAIDATEYADTMLAFNKYFTYRIAAKLDTFISNWSNIDSSKTTLLIPYTPTDLTATAVNANTVYLSWTLLSENEDGIIIEDSSSLTNSWRQSIDIIAGRRDYSLGGFEEQEIYYFRVKAYNEFGDSEYSDVDSARTPMSPPVAPGNLAIDSSSYNLVILSWTDNAFNEDGYFVQRHETWTENWDEIADLPANSITFTDTTIEPETEYGYQVRSYNPVGNSRWSNEVTLRTPVGPPPAPYNLELRSTTPNSVLISWRSAVHAIDGFKIERSEDAANFAEIGETDGEATSLQDYDLAASTWYWYRMRSFNQAGYSAYSGIDSVRTLSNVIRY